LGREGGDASAADAILVALPSAAIADRLVGLRGIPGQVTIDATNTFDETAERLIHDAGFDPIYLGDLSQARLLERLISG
jgi:predicted dinucleotide-binding enzyme